MIRLAALALFVLSLTLPAVAQVGSPPTEIRVDPLVICEDVLDREPVHPVEFLDADGAAFCFSRILTPEPIVVEHVWYHENTEMARVALEASPPAWRVWSRKSLFGMSGIWRVDIVDEQGAVLRSIHFKAE